VRAGWRRALATLVTGVFLVFDANASGVLRVGTSGDYAPFSIATPDARAVSGFDMAIASRYARDHGMTLAVVRFRWPRLADDLAADRFDVAMSGVTVRPERSALGRFTMPVVESGAVVLVRPGRAASTLDALDDPAMRIAVNAGGHLEQIARARFRRATLLAIADNHGVRRRYADGTVDAVVSDVFEAPVWRADVPGTTVIGPLTRDRKAYLVAATRPALAADLDAWLLAREADGTLGALRRRYFRTQAAVATALPLAALIAAIDERLALMPLVAAAKRERELPIADAGREARVHDAMVARMRIAAQRARVPPPREVAMRTFMTALIAAAKEVQGAAMEKGVDAAAESPPSFGLETALRPAIDRIDERVAQLVVALPPNPGAADIEAAVADGVRSPNVSAAARVALARAIAALAPRLESGRRRAVPRLRRPGAPGWWQFGATDLQRPRRADRDPVRADRGHATCRPLAPRVWTVPPRRARRAASASFVLPRRRGAAHPAPSCAIKLATFEK
jgi:cyclohexadienyl dehydratase